MKTILKPLLCACLSGMQVAGVFARLQCLYTTHSNGVLPFLKTKGKQFLSRMQTMA